MYDFFPRSTLLIAKLLEKELNISKNSDVDMRGLVYLTLEELERYNLIKDYVKRPISTSGIPRRTVVKTGILVGGFAIGSMFPVVRSIVAPESAVAISAKKYCEVLLIGGVSPICILTVVSVNGSTTYTCSSDPGENGCTKKGGSCKTRPKKNSDPDCICVKDPNCTWK